MAVIPPRNLPAAASVASSDVLIVDKGSTVEKATSLQVVDAAIPLATQEEAETGTDNEKRVTPLRVSQAISALSIAASDLGSSASGKGTALIGDERGGTLEKTIATVAIAAETYGAAGDGTTDDSTALNDALSAAVAKNATVRLVRGKTYAIGAPVFLQAGVPLDLNGAKLRRLASYTTAESAIRYTGTNSAADIINVYGGSIEDLIDSDTTSGKISMVQLSKCKVARLHFDKASTEKQLVAFAECDRVDFHVNDFSSPRAYADLNQHCLAAEISKCNNISCSGYIHNSWNALNIEADGASFDSLNVDLSNLIIADTYDTAIFCRALGSNANQLRRVSVTGGVLYNIGKAGIKFSVPSSITGTGYVLDQLDISGMIVKGFGFNVDSCAISSFSDDSQIADSAINSISIRATIDGRDDGGTVSALSGDLSGIRIANANKVKIDANITNCPEEGIFLSNVDNFSVTGVVTECCRTGGEAGLYVLNCNHGVIVGDYSSNLDHGIYLSRTQNVRVVATANGNTGYGLYVPNDGGNPAWTDFCTFSVTATGNSSGGIFQNAGIRNYEVGCVDDSGSRNQGGKTRRDALGLKSTGNLGHLFYNSDSAQIEYWNGSGWLTNGGMNTRGDVNITINPGSQKPVQYFNAPLSTNRTVTLSSSGVSAGSRFRVVRAASASGASTLSVGGLKSLSAGQWVDVEYDGSSWLVTGHGSL